jgi:hypothetical protein
MTARAMGAQVSAPSPMPTALGGKTCFSQTGHSQGELSCLASCLGLDISGCHTPGNGVAEGPKLCDGADLAGATCLSETGLLDGALICHADGMGFDASGCFTCGNQTIEGPELCEGNDVGGATCASEAGLTHGSVSSTTDCLDIDVSGCYECGNGAIEGPELCDGASLDGETCQSLTGHADGLPSCLANCLGYDTSSCHTVGNGVIEGPEVCDGAKLGGETCLSIAGASTGALACGVDGLSFDTSGGTSCSTVADILAQTGCNPGDACDIDSGTPPFECRAAGTTAHYDPCTAPTDCMAGASCFNVGSGSRCLPYCDIAAPGPCPGTGTCAATMPGYPGLGLCLPHTNLCDPVDNSGCTGGDVCVFTVVGADCVTPTSNPSPPGALCDQGSPGGCVAGASCFGTGTDFVCFELCHLSDGTGCSAGTCQDALSDPDFGLCQ